MRFAPSVVLVGGRGVTLVGVTGPARLSWLGAGAWVSELAAEHPQLPIFRYASVRPVPINSKHGKLLVLPPQAESAGLLVFGSVRGVPGAARNASSGGRW